MREPSMDNAEAMTTNQNSVDIVRVVQSELELAGHSLVTGQVRAVSAKVYRALADKSIDHVLKLCEQLLTERTWALGVVAYDWAFRVRKHYKHDTFAIFERWLKQYITGWGDCDDFCTHAFGALLAQDNSLFQQVLTWTQHPEFTVRRAAAVILIYPIKQGLASDLDPYVIANRLMHDEHYLVQKGYGWMLKVLSSVEPEQVLGYLMQNKVTMPRLALRYAAEKLDQKTRALVLG